MVFESGWFLRQMNKFAPRGFEFKTVDNTKRIALYSREIMGNQTPRGPFISEFSFDLLDCLFSGMLTKSATIINPAERASAYLGSFETTRREEHPETITQAAANDQVFNIYKKIVLNKRNMVYPVRPFMFKKNAVLIQGMMDSHMTLPSYLSKRISKYTSDATWHAIYSVFSSMSIAQMKESMEKYGAKKDLLGITPGVVSDGVRLPEFIRKKNYENTDAYIAWLKYDILPDCTATATEQVSAELERLTRIRDSYAPIPPIMPARDFMPDFFFEPENASAKQSVSTNDPDEEPIDLFTDMDTEFMTSYNKPKLAEIPERPLNVPAPATEMSPNPPVFETRRLRKNTLAAKNAFGQMATLISLNMKKTQKQK